MGSIVSNNLFRISLYELLLKGNFKNGGKSDMQRFTELYELKQRQLAKLLQIDFFHLESIKGSEYSMSQKKRLDALIEEVNTLYAFYNTITELMKLYDTQLEKMCLYYHELPMKCYTQGLEIQSLKISLKIWKLAARLNLRREQC